MADQILRSGFRFYQSANADAESIKEGFIIRQNEYEIIIGDIRRNNMEGSIQHYLLLGRRGSGKSTLLKRIQVEIETDEELRGKYIAINPAEEQANIYRLSDFWNEILQELEYAGIEVSFPEWEDDAQSYSQKLAAAVHEAIHKSGKKVILLLDNIDRIFENLRDGASMLREYLLNFDDLKIIGGSTRMTEHFWRYDLPFYEFFRVIRLEPLSSEEVKKLLLYWGDKLGEDALKEFVQKKTGQLETIRILTDGLPRTLQFFVNILLTQGPETGYEYLRLIMDQVTPLYQERLNTLPPSQRKIVLQMAFLWEAAGSKEIAEASHMDNKVISAQMKQLVDKGLVDRIETDNKNHLYRLSERFFNLWLIFTQGSPHEKRKARCLTIFLENFYSPDELRGLASAHLKRLHLGELHPNKLALITKAIAQSKYISSAERDELIKRTIALKNIDHDLKRQLPLLTNEINEKIIVLVDKKDWINALKMANGIEQDDDAKWFMLGYIYNEKGDFGGAEKYYKMASENGDSIALLQLAIIYKHQKKLDDAEKHYLMAIENGNNRALLNIGYFYEGLERFNEAEEYYKLGIKKGEKDCMLFLGVLYEDQKRFSEAEKYYKMAYEKGCKDGSFFLGAYYNEQGKINEAEHYYLLSINEQGDAAAMISLAILYYSENIKKAEAKELVYRNKETLLRIVIDLWSGEVNKATIKLRELIFDSAFDIFNKYFQQTLLDFLVHHQSNFILSLFLDEQFGGELKGNYQPFYYAASILAGKDKNIALKIPPELTETVNKLVEDIMETQEFYYGKPTA